MYRRSQRGMAALQLALVMPAILLLIVAVAQTAEWQHAVHTAQAAAARGVETARVRAGTDAGGAAAARDAAAQFSILQGATVTVTRTASTVRVEVRGTAPSVFPGMRIPVDAVAVGPIEGTS